MTVFPKILLFFILGIYIQDKTPAVFPPGILIGITTVGIVGGSLALVHPRTRSNNTLLYLCCISGLFVLGFFLSQNEKITVIRTPPGGTFSGIIRDPPVKKTRTCQFTCQIQAVNHNNHWVSIREKVLVRIASDTFSSTLAEGNVLIFRGKWTPLPLINPSSYEAYLLRKQITHTVYVAAGQWSVIRENGFVLARKWAVNLRRKMLEQYLECGLSNQEFAVAAALTLGYKASLERDIREAYAATGASHILAISGLHTGIVYLMASGMLWWMGRSSRMRVIRTMLLLSFLWFFALLTGLSPSVVRAAWMLTLAETGRCLKRSSVGWNYVTASAFIILAVHPLMLYDVGFQMSYMAVLSLMSFLRKPNGNHPQKTSVLSWLTQNVIQLFQVSGAAQAGTTPLSLHYFHQFPPWFFLTNLLVVPLSAIVLYTAALTLILHPVPFLGEVAGGTFRTLVGAMNYTVLMIGKLPGGLLTNIEFPSGQVVYGYLTMIFAALYLHRKDIFFLYGLLAVLCLWVIG